MNKKNLTLCCVYNNESILLGMKKRGVGMELWNGFGGKVEDGETIQEAAIRELKEEAGIAPVDMKKRAVITFEFDEENNPFNGKPIVDVHIFSVTEFKGEPHETEEMRPQWFLHREIPFDNMWPDDKHWMPLLLAGKNFQGTFYLKDSKTIKSFELKEVEKIA